MAFRFESLDIWHLARKYADLVYKITAKFPRKEDLGLTSQLNRAVNSISLNIAEGAGTDSNKEFDRFLGYSVRSVFEIVGGMFLALDRKYITEIEHKELYDQGTTLSKKINAFRKTIR